METHVHMIIDIDQKWAQAGKDSFRILAFKPVDPNPAIAARAVFSQSGHSRPEKRPFFQIYKKKNKKKYIPKANRIIGLQYITLNPRNALQSAKEIISFWGNPGEIPHIGCKVHWV